jgi:hypothetical protein
LLADYEEGTWSPGISFGGATTGITYSNQNGYYTKIGNVVTLSCYLALTNKGSATGAAKITGLPFTSNNNLAVFAAVSLRLTSVLFNGFPQGYVDMNATTISLGQSTLLGVASNLTDVDFANASDVIINITYRVS